MCIPTHCHLSLLILPCCQGRWWIPELVPPGLGHSWTCPWVSWRGQGGCAGQWDRGHAEQPRSHFSGVCPCTCKPSRTGLAPPGHQSSPCPIRSGSLDLVGSEAGRSVCCSLPGAGREGSVSFCTQAATGVGVGPKSTHSSPPSCPQQGGDSHTSVPRVWRTGFPQGEARAVCVQAFRDVCASLHIPGGVWEGRGDRGHSILPGQLPCLSSECCLPRARGWIPSGSEAAWAERKAGFGLQTLLLPSPPPPPLWEHGWRSGSTVTPGLVLPARGREKGKKPDVGQILFLVF